MNGAVKPFFNESFGKKEVCESCEQCMGSTRNTPQSQNAHLKKKKKKEENTYAKRCLFINTQMGTWTYDFRFDILKLNLKSRIQLTLGWHIKVKFKI